MQLGQPLKSFRDRRVDFAKAQAGAQALDYLGSLGPLHKPGRD